ncbi:MAG TPA: vWA domain-containing protein, partial [Pyrinomonadaceae bacterium]|nr:vWA domain-containing protein [Pyrinomonadaceae bacterium]
MSSSGLRRQEGRGRLCLAAALVALICLCCFITATPTARAFSVPSITINVPRKALNMSQTEISTLKITVSVTSTAPVSFTVTPPGGGPVMVGPLSPGSPNVIGQAVGSDFMNVIPPSNALMNNDPLKRKYVIVINLVSNIDSMCNSTMPTPETFTIATTGPQIDGVCAQSLDPNVGFCNPGVPGGLRTVPLTEPVATVAPTGSSGTLQGCRPGVDCVLVLDRSGSMDDPTLGGPNPALPKLSALKTAVSTFMTTWRDLRTNEEAASPGVPGIATPTDRVGVVFFDSSNPALWLQSVPGVPAGTTTPGMNQMANDAETMAVTSDISTRTNAVTTGGSTSIGSGFRLGDGALAPLLGNGNRKVFVLMTDGMENTAPFTRA